jgi:DNA modification methylase
MMTYEEYLASKVTKTEISGFEVSLEALHPILKGWQKVIVQHALKMGKYALLENTGLGKTLQYGEWAKHVAAHTGMKVLIVTPLSVADQTIRELDKKLQVAARYCRSQEEAESCEEQIIVTNYDMLKVFDPEYFSGLVLDESSILKSYMGKLKQYILETFANTPYKLACTATAAPNDHMEYGNHAEFIDAMSSTDVLQRFFINDTMEAGGYRLLGWADTTKPMGFWTWLSSWAACISKPSDIPGFTDDDFVLPNLVIHEEVVSIDHTRAFDQGQLVISGKLSATGVWKEKALTLEDRCIRAREVYDRIQTHEPVVVWCQTNDEADRLVQLFPDFVEVRGEEKREVKLAKLRDFGDGKYPGIITKAEIAGYGMNWQHAGNHIFVGVTYSFEDFYQSIRRSYRYMREGDVHAWLIYAETEGNVRKALEMKQKEYDRMQSRMNEAMRIYGLDRAVDRKQANIEIDEDVASGEGWTNYLGDCVLTARKHIAADSVDFSIFSPPFAELYRYTDKVADMGNVANMDEFFEGFDYMIHELYRVIKPGRLVAVHCKDLPLYMNRDAAAGLRDFPGEIVNHFQKYQYDRDHIPSEDPQYKNRRWILHSKVTIWKDPVIEMQRTKNHGLLWKNFMERGEVVRQGMADYLYVFRKWVDMDEMPDKQIQRVMKAPGFHDGEDEHVFIGENPPLRFDGDRDYSIQVWQKYASPVWDDIRQTNVLNGRIAREDRDQKHICPLQLDVIDRGIDLWTNPGDLVYDPYNGVGSTTSRAVQMHRRAVGSELKKTYWKLGNKHNKQAEQEARNVDLFAYAASLPIEEQAAAD